MNYYGNIDIRKIYIIEVKEMVENNSIMKILDSNLTDAQKEQLRLQVDAFLEYIG